MRAKNRLLRIRFVVPEGTTWRRRRTRRVRSIERAFFKDRSRGSAAVEKQTLRSYAGRLYAAVATWGCVRV